MTSKYQRLRTTTANTYEKDEVEEAEKVFDDSGPAIQRHFFVVSEAVER